MDTPDIILINSLRYKIGVHGKVFVLLADEWKLSSRPVEEIEAAFERRARARYLRELAGEDQ